MTVNWGGDGMARRLIRLFLAIAPILCNGCGGDNSVGPFSVDSDLGSLEQFLKQSLNRFDNPAEFTKVRVEKLAPISGDVTRIEFVVEGEYLRDSYIEVN